MTRAVTPERQVGRQFVVISLLGFFRTFTGAIVGTGIALFILVHWGSNFLSGVSVAAIAVTYMFSPVLMGRLSDRLGRKMSLEIATTGNLVLSACYVVVVVLVQLGAAWWLIVLIMVFTVLGLLAGEIINIWVFFAVFGVGGLLFGTIYSEAINMMMINGNEKKRGLLMGVFESFIGIGFFVGPLLAGHLTEVYTYTISYQSVAIIMGPVIVACLVAWLVSRLPRVPGG